MRDCIKRIVEKSKGKIKASDAKQMVRDVETQAKRKAAEEGIEYDDAVDAVIADRIANVEANIKKEKANLSRNIIIKKQTENTLQGFVDANLSVQDSVRAMLEGIERPIPGVRNSIEAQKNAVKSIQLSEFVGKMTRENLMTIFADGKLSDEIGAALWELSNKKKPRGGSKEANRIAEIIHEVRDGQRQRMNKAGADIAEVSGYIMPQRHDIVAMLKVGKEKWVADMQGLLDTSRTFGGDYEDLGDALRSAYDAMVTGVRLTDPTQKDAKLFQFSGPANLAKKLSRSRDLHFKDYASWKQWNNTYGMKSLHEGVVEAMARDAESTALLERFGTNPEAMVKAATDNVVKANRTKLKAGDGTQAKIQTMIDGMMEKQKIPADATLANIGSNIRAYNSVTKLGGALISSITDIPMKALEYNYQGKNFLSATSKAFLDTAYGFKSKKERVEFASQLGVYMESIVGDVGARFSAFDDVQGKAAKVTRLFFRLNGLTWWTDSHKAAFSRTMAHDLGLKAGKGFDELDADTKRLFGNYDITSADWDKMRAGVTTLEDGRAYVLGEKIADKKVAQKLVTYILDRQESAVITPGAREARIATFGNLQRGTAAGETVRLIMQFKNFPLTIGTKVIGRAVYGKGKLDVPAMAYLMLMSGVFGYLSGAMKDIVRGKTPKDPLKLETIYASLAQGGGLGIMGDLLLSDASGFGRSASSIMAGPTLGKVDELFKIYSAGIRGGGSKRQAVMTGINSIPFNNLFYTRAALDQLILLQMQEELNPGYLRRTQRNAEKTYGQKPLFK